MLSIIVSFPDDLVKTDSAEKSAAFFSSILKAIIYVYTYAGAMYCADCKLRKLLHSDWHCSQLSVCVLGDFVGLQRMASICLGDCFVPQASPELSSPPP